jgi:putative aldouronate transport system permease protein
MPKQSSALPAGSLSYRRKEGQLLFFCAIPFFVATFVFCYLPPFGWSYAFYDYRIGWSLRNCEFVGLKHFLAPFQNPIVRSELGRVMKNTLGIAMINFVGSVLPLVFAVFLAEINSSGYRRVVQTVTTFPNFVSWVLVYALAYAMFAVDDGFINNLLKSWGLVDQGINFLASNSHMWIKMWLYTCWKGLGWSAILYIASMSAIDPELYEAAEVDGARRFHRIWYITVPHLLPTFFTLMVLNIANLINSGFEQYFIFQNAINKESIEVLDLFVYNKGIGSASNNISYTTAVGILKSVVSIALLFAANGLSKVVRKEKIF